MLPQALSDLISDFAALPGIGPKSATRMALSLLKNSDSRLQDFSKHLANLKENVHYCPICFNFSNNGNCDICEAKDRVQTKILVLEDPLEVTNFEEIKYDGLYHILGGLISPLQSVGPSDLRIKELLVRVRMLLEANTSKKKKSAVKIEIILALATSLEGEATASYLKNFLEADPALKGNHDRIIISNLARGIPANTMIEYQDRSTLRSSLENRN